MINCGHVACLVPLRWNQIFKSRIVKTIALYGNTSFMVAIAILVFLLIGTCARVQSCRLTVNPEQLVMKET